MPVFSWTGCYLGLYIGDDTGRFDSNINVPTTRGGAAPAAGLVGSLTNDTHMSGFVGGGTAGCNYQVYNCVWGIEVDSGVTNKDGQDFPTLPINRLLIFPDPIFD